MRKLITICMAVLFYTANAQTSKTDEKFTKCASSDGLAEVRMGELALTHAANAEVKTNARRMVEDHSKANEELGSLAAKKNLPRATALTKCMQKKYDKLAKLNGKSFDKRYTKCMVHAHKKTVCLFKRESKKGKDPELKAWAAEKLPTLEKHLDAWKSTCRTLKSS